MNLSRKQKTSGQVDTKSKAEIIELIAKLPGKMSLRDIADYVQPKLKRNWQANLENNHCR